MTELGFFKLIIFIILLLLVTKPLGIYIKKVMTGERTFLDFLFIPIERLIYTICRIDRNQEHTWKEYCLNVLLFGVFGGLFLYLFQVFQHYFPLNPQDFGAVPSTLALNTTISFVTNTNWQAYSGESTLSYFVDIMGLTVQNFVSAATGIAVAIALARSFMRKDSETIGNFWADLVRCCLWILLPACIIVSLIYIWQGVPQNISDYITAHTLEGTTQIIPQGPIASFEAIKLLGTNGGGLLGANSMHPYENPTAMTNLIQCLSMLAIGSALTYTFGLMVNNKKQGWTILISMLILFTVLMGSMYYCESKGNPFISKTDNFTNTLAVDNHSNMEGKESRFGVTDSVMYASSTTSASCGGVNASMDTLNPLSGGIAMLNIALGEIIIGGVGSGFYGMIMFAILTVFIAGLMVGRTPEFLGKKIGILEMKWVMLALLISPFCVLFFTAIGCFIPGVVAELKPYGSHGFSRLLYSFISAANNNGSAFGGLNANTDFINITTGISMLLGRYVTIIAILGTAGALVKKKIIPPSAGTFPTTGPIFVVMLLVCILIIGGLNFFPALSLGPILEHLMLFH